MKPLNKKNLLAGKLLIVIIIALSCEKEGTFTKKGYTYFPVGRISVMNNNITVKTNNRDLIYELVYDSCGGYWLKFNPTQLEDDSEVTVKFTRTSQPTEDFIDNTHLENWLEASYYIDCEEDAIVSKALEVTEGLDSNMDKATKIMQYVVENIEFVMEFHKTGDVKATETLETGYGTCMNFSRLFVALCRAAKIPARSIWGIVYGDDYGTDYNFHHQWAEICDEEGMWHTCDLTKCHEFFNNDIEYLDLVYGAEENSTITGNTEWLSLINDMDYWHNYPVATSGSLPGFELVADHSPDSMVVEYVIQF